MQKRLFWLLLPLIAAVAAVAFALVSMTSVVKAASAKRVGLNVDSARVFNNPTVLRKYINLVAKGHGNYLQLHLTDNERFGVESTLLGQTTKNATLKKGVYYSKTTGQAFLSKAQLKSLIAYGAKKHVEVIPEIDLPGHAKALLRLLKGTDVATYNAIKSDHNELNYQSQATINFAQKLMSEYTGLVPAGRYISIGADEFGIYDEHDEVKAADFIDQMNRFVNQQGLKMTIWNDGIFASQLKRLDKNILVNYWRPVNDVTSSKYNREHATAPEINKAGLKTINCNAYYTYIVARPKMFTKESVDYWKDAIHEWNLTIWNDDHRHQVNHSKNTIGAAVSVWSEPDKPYSGNQTYTKSRSMISTFFNRLK